MIQQKVIDMMKRSEKSKICKARLQLELDKAAPTIQRYLDDNDIMLTTAKALAVIRDVFQLTDEEILEPQTVS